MSRVARELKIMSRSKPREDLAEMPPVALLLLETWHCYCLILQMIPLTHMLPKLWIISQLSLWFWLTSIASRILGMNTQGRAYMYTNSLPTAWLLAICKEGVMVFLPQKIWFCQQILHNGALTPKWSAGEILHSTYNKYFPLST